jgi:hypothetical protein
MQGFALVLVVLALLAFVTAFMLYGALGSASKRLTTGSSNNVAFKRIDEALASFVMAHSRLPCPASGTAQNGLEDPKPSALDPYQDCNSPSGIVPWSTIGLRDTDARDTWGRYIGYRVFDGAKGFTRSTVPGLALADCLNEPVATVYALSGASVTCNSTTHENTFSDYFATYGITINDMGTVKKVAYALVSMGESGLGAYYPGGASALSLPSSSSKEFLNAGSGGTYWVTAGSDPTIAADSASHFDDVISYVSGSDLVRNASFRPGKAWPLSTVFNRSNLGVTTSNYNTGVASLKVATSGGPVMVTAAADSPQKVCGLSSTPEGVAPCTTQTNGNNLLVTTNNERVTFDFRVTRRYAVLQLTEFRASGGGDNERALVTFFNAAGTQVDQQTVTACATGGSNRIGHYRLTATGDFTKIEVRGTTKTGGGNSDLGVAAIMACKIGTDCPTPPAYPAGWTAPVC